jgi:hypothetical protein
MLNLFLQKLPVFTPWLFGGVRVALLFSHSDLIENDHITAIHVF